MALVIAAVLALGVLGAGWLLLSRRVPEGPPAAAEAPSAPAEAPGAADEAPSPRPRAAAPPPAPAPGPAEPAPELATLHIDADVPGANVFIDRRYVGTTPVTAEGIRPGAHRLNVTAEGFDGILETIDVEPGPRKMIYRLRDVRLDATLAVVHRHGIGSCRGRLVASPEGLRFEPEDGDHGFSASLDELDAFEVDYLEKRLSLRLRGGRRYDFRDPDDDADRLFVFHRDVEQARQRLGLVATD